MGLNEHNGRQNEKKYRNSRHYNESNPSLADEVLQSSEQHRSEEEDKSCTAGFEVVGSDNKANEGGAKQRTT